MAHNLTRLAPAPALSLPPPRSKPGNTTITLKIREPDGNEIMFKVKRS
jgi:hypothetical protein